MAGKKYKTASEFIYDFENSYKDKYNTKSYVFCKSQNDKNKWIEDYNDRLDIEINKQFINKGELKDKINKILDEFAKSTDVDGRETLYKYTDCDLYDLKKEILKLLEE